MAWIVRRDLKTGPRFYVRYSYNGRRYWFSAGKTRRVAELAKSKLEVQIAEGRILEKVSRSDWTLGQLGKVYLARMEQLRPKSTAWRRDRWKQILQVLGADHPIEAVTLETLDRYAERRLAAGKAVATVKGEISVIRHALHQARRWRGETGLSEYRLTDWDAPKNDRAREPVFLSPAEVKRLLAAARRCRLAAGEPAVRMGEAALCLALATGARVSEIAGIRWGDLDPRTGFLRLRTLKGGPRRGVELDRKTLEIVRSLRPRGAKPSDLVLPGDPGLKPKERFREFWDVARAAAGLQHVRFHDLRHTFSAEFLRRGGKLRQLQVVLGHTTARMTERYAHFERDYRPVKAVAWSRGAQSGASKGRSGE